MLNTMTLPLNSITICTRPLNFSYKAKYIIFFCKIKQPTPTLKTMCLSFQRKLTTYEAIAYWVNVSPKYTIYL